MHDNKLLVEKNASFIFIANASKCELQDSKLSLNINYIKYIILYMKSDLTLSKLV